IHNEALENDRINAKVLEEEEEKKIKKYKIYSSLNERNILEYFIAILLMREILIFKWALACQFAKGGGGGRNKMMDANGKRESSYYVLDELRRDDIPQANSLENEVLEVRAAIFEMENNKAFWDTEVEGGHVAIKINDQ
ncbi:hypothetical protein ACJX0J_015761, partial [Zea mays]